MATSGALFGIGDLVSQYFFHSAKNKKNGTVDGVVFNFERTAIFAGFGAFMASPILMFHYQKFLPWIAPGRGVSSTLMKVGVDQTVFAPFFLTYLFFVLSKLQGDSSRQAWNTATGKLWSTLLVNWSIWPLVQFANFFFVPIAY